MFNVLLLEPDKVLAATYAAALRHAGYETISVQGAQEALHALEEWSVRAIVLELQLTAHGGVEFLHELRSYPEWQQLPVIVNTNLAPTTLQPLHEILTHDFGVTACLYKPRTSLTQLIRVVNEQARV